MGSQQWRDYYEARAAAGLDATLATASVSKAGSKPPETISAQKKVPPLPASLLLQEGHLGDTQRQPSAELELSAEPGSTSLLAHASEQVPQPQGNLAVDAAPASQVQQPSGQLGNLGTKAAEPATEPSLLLKVAQLGLCHPNKEASSQEAPQARGLLRAPMNGKGKGPGVQPPQTSGPLPDHMLPERISEGAIYKRLNRLMAPRADGSYLLPPEMVQEYQNKATRPNVLNAFERVGYNPEARLDYDQQWCVFDSNLQSTMLVLASQGSFRQEGAENSPDGRRSSNAGGLGVLDGRRNARLGLVRATLLR